MAEGDDFERRLMVFSDVKDYSTRTANQQKRVQTGFLTVLDRAAERAALARDTWEPQPAGDGELAVLPPAEPEPRVVDDFIRHLAAEIRRYNRDQPEAGKLRLRVAIHYGPAIRAGNGYSGNGPVAVSRLCASAPLRGALDGSGAALAVILSDRVFSETVAQEHTSLDPAMFRKVSVRVKEFAEDAWIWVPDHDIAALPLPDDSPAPGDEAHTHAQSPSPPAPPTPPSPGPGPRPGSSGGNFTGARVVAGKVIGGDEHNYGLSS